MQLPKIYDDAVLKLPSNSFLLVNCLDFKLVFFSFFFIAITIPIAIAIAIFISLAWTGFLQI